jgi:hypothetical protein
MFVGHFATALAGKAIAPRAPLWSYIAASQLVDWGWSALILAGVEHMRLNPSLPGSPLELYDMPWTHSLPAALVWAAGGGLFMRYVMKTPIFASVMVGVVVFSHWLEDLLVHRPDLEIWPGGTRLGFGMWNHPVPEMIVEMGLLAVCGALWIGQRKDEGRRAWPGAVFIGALVTLALVAVSLPGEGKPAGMATTALVAYLVVTLGAWWLDRKPAPRAV